MKRITCESCCRAYATEDDFLNYTSSWRICSDKNLWYVCDCGSGSFIPDGEWEWFPSARGFSNRKSEIFKIIVGFKDVPYIPSHIIHLQNIISDEASSTKAVVEELLKLPTVADKILQIANNLAYSSKKGEISELAYAVSYVGRKTLVDLLVVASLNAFDFKTKKYRPQEFWRESVRNAKIAEYLVGEFDLKVSVVEAQIASALCNVGKLIAAILFPEDVDKLYSKCLEENKPWFMLERDILRYRHSVIGGISASFWGLSDYILDGIEKHHCIGDEYKGSGGAVDIMAFAEEAESISLTQVVVLANTLRTMTECSEDCFGDEFISCLRSEFSLSVGAWNTLLQHIQKTF